MDNNSTRFLASLTLVVDDGCNVTTHTESIRPDDGLVAMTEDDLLAYALSRTLGAVGTKPFEVLGEAIVHHAEGGYTPLSAEEEVKLEPLIQAASDYMRMVNTRRAQLREKWGKK